MAENFGFVPVGNGNRYFISYKSEDYRRVGEITRELNRYGVPMWYDYGIEKGERWKKEINRNISECDALILFATKNLFFYEDNYVRLEYDIAEYFQKPIFVVWLDDVKKKDVNRDIVDWFLKLKALQGIETINRSVNQIACTAITEFHLINGRTPQPVTVSEMPSYQVTDAYFHYTNHFDMGKSALPVTVKTFSMISVLAAVIVISIIVGFWISNVIQTKDTEPPVNSQITDSSVSSENGTVSSDTDDDQVDLSVGDSIILGNYPQSSNYPEPIEWLVLDVQGSRALVISDKLLDSVRYNESYENITWENCTLRAWLNHDFLNTAFNSSEKSRIEIVTNINLDNSVYGTEGGSTTQDSVFVLSIDEVKKYFKGDDKRKAVATYYAKSHGSYVSNKYSLASGEKTSWWWLRSPGDYGYNAARVDSTGYIREYGCGVYASDASVRPAMWIKV